MTDGRGPVIAVLGSINMDLVTTTDRRPRPGETVLGSGFAMVPGGKGANQAVAAGRAGGQVEFIGAVGDDVFADELRAVLRESGVGTARLRTFEGPSGIAAIVVDAGGENSIIVVGGANSSVTELSDEDLVVIAAADILLCQLEIPVVAVRAAARHAKANGTIVVLNPSPTRALPPELWADIDVAVVNSGEFTALGSALEPVPHLVVTLGADGARHRGPDGVELSVPGSAVEVVDTTGAGDTFTGALAVAWDRGPAEALRFACAAGALATTRLGASVSIPRRDEIHAALRAADFAP
ncbi:ribokinase [Nocardia cyriacigeorgica]|uniref:Ribokinase n=1 Tax=Nocardia cyriacigeorgica TaxID=135487 RepID=A0A6P1D6H4_9NOCA|nr:ribokinase [Nocardia cyriacigeorgica]NEW42344.1 ribokinase [Nocardia cyriacigeorgica]NEW46047.1 ribokinase [Nocardia cyriacigeorgica]